MKNKFMKKLTVLCTAATLACSSAPAYATVPAVTEMCIRDRMYSVW